MSRILRNPIDKRLEHRPCDYLDNPSRFGTSQPIRAHIPLGGDKKSLRIALAQHQLAKIYNTTNPNKKKPTVQITEEYGFSKATWSRTLTGQRWAGTTGIIALLEASRTSTM